MTPEQQFKNLMASMQKNAEMNARARQEADRNTYLTQIGRYFSAALQPLKEAVDEMKRIGSNLGILSSRLNSLEIPKPEVNVDLSSLRIPTPNLTVKPIVDISTIKMPNEMNVKGWMNLMGYDRSLLTDPLPVQLRDSKGNPIKLFDNIAQVIGGGGGWAGGGNHVIVDQMPSISVSATTNSSVSLVNADGTYYDSGNPLPITGSITTTPGATFYASDAIGSVNLIQVGGNSVVVGTGYQDNALRTVQATDSVSSVSVVSNIAALDVKQVSGSIDSVNLTQIAGNTTVVGTGYQDNALRVVNATDAVTSVNIMAQGLALETRQVSGAIDSVSIVSNIAALDVKQVSGSVDSVSAFGVAMTTNPTAVSDTAAATMKTDKLGRQLSRPVQVRELIATAYASITNGTETTLATASAAGYLDLIYVMGTNNSDAAVTVDLRAVSSGNIMLSVRIPANGTAGVSLPVPIPQDATGNAWTADLPDITGTVVTISALFSKEI